MDQARSHRSGQVSRGRNRDEQVNGTGPDGQGRDERADDDEPAEQVARIPVHGHRSRRADHSGGEDDQRPIPAGQPAPTPRRPGRRLRGLPLPPRSEPAGVGRGRRRGPLIQVRCNEPQVVPGRLSGAWPYRALVAPTRPHLVLLMAPRPRLADLARFRSRLVLLTAARSGPARFRRSPVRSAWLTRSWVASARFRRSPVRSAWLTRSWVASARFRRAGFPAAGRQRTWPGPPRLPAADRTTARTMPAGLRAALITARPGTRPVRLERGAVVRPVRVRPVRVRPVRVRPVRVRPVRAGLVRVRPVRAGLVRAGLVKPGIGLGGAAVAARRAPVLPKGSRGRTRRRRPRIPALGPAVMGASGRPTIRPGHATVRRARIHVVPSRLLGHLDSDVSRCRSLTRAARWSSRHGCCAGLAGKPVARAHPRASARPRADHGIRAELCFFRNNSGCRRLFLLSGAGCERPRLLARGCRGSFHRQTEHFADGGWRAAGLDGNVLPASIPCSAASRSAWKLSFPPSQ
jgi:hypothetical protein